MANCLFLHDSLITNFDFMNYAFPKLVVASLQKKIPQWVGVYCEGIVEYLKFPFDC